MAQGVDTDLRHNGGIVNLDDVLDNPDAFLAAIASLDGQIFIRNDKVSMYFFRSNRPALQMIIKFLQRRTGVARGSVSMPKRRCNRRRRAYTTTGSRASSWRCMGGTTPAWTAA